MITVGTLCRDLAADAAQPAAIQSGGSDCGFPLPALVPADASGKRHQLPASAYEQDGSRQSPFFCRPRPAQDARLPPERVIGPRARFLTLYVFNTFLSNERLTVPGQGATIFGMPTK